VNQRMRRQLGRGLAWIVIAAPCGRLLEQRPPGQHQSSRKRSARWTRPQQSGAAVSVPVELRTAEDKLKAARTALANKVFDQAIRVSEQAGRRRRLRACPANNEPSRRWPTRCARISRRCARSSSASPSDEPAPESE